MKGSRPWHCPCGSVFYASGYRGLAPSGSLCPACAHLAMIRAAARSAGDTITKEEALALIDSLASKVLDNPTRVRAGRRAH